MKNRKMAYLAAVEGLNTRRKRVWSFSMQPFVQKVHRVNFLMSRKQRSSEAPKTRYLFVVSFVFLWKKNQQMTPNAAKSIRRMFHQKYSGRLFITYSQPVSQSVDRSVGQPARRPVGRIRSVVFKVDQMKTKIIPIIKTSAETFFAASSG